MSPVATPEVIDQRRTLLETVVRRKARDVTDLLETRQPGRLFVSSLLSGAASQLAISAAEWNATEMLADQPDEEEWRREQSDFQFGYPQRPTDPTEAAIFDALMTRGVWERHLRGGHAIDAAKHAVELASILGAFVSRREAPPAFNEQATDDAGLAVERVLTIRERREFMDRFVQRNPQYQGAHVADVLDEMLSRDSFLSVVEPIYEVHGKDVPEPHLLAAALFVVILSDGGIQHGLDVESMHSAADLTWAFQQAVPIIERVRARGIYKP